MIGKLDAKTVRVPFVSVFHFKHGKIAEQRDMFDVTHFLVQLGAIPEPFGPEAITRQSGRKLSSRMSRLFRHLH